MAELTLTFDIDLLKYLDSIATVPAESDDFIPISSTRTTTVSEQGRRPAHIYFSCITDDGANYPEKTDLYCWWCRHQFSEEPIGDPQSYIRDKNVFICSGIFCSFPCLKAYLRDGNRDETLLTLMYLKCGEKLPVPSANSWKELKEYGGTLSLEKFKENFKRVKILTTLLSTSTAFLVKI
jgi:hypothetical protein